MRTKNVEVEKIYNVNLILFDEVYREYNRAIYANILKIIKDPDGAQDVFQEVFLTLWKKLDEKSTIQSYASWLFVVSHNKSISYLKKKVSESLVWVENYDMFESVSAELLDNNEIASKQLSIIEEAVGSLPKRKKEVFILSKYEGKNIDEIADKLDISQASVTEYLKQSIRLVREYISVKYSTSDAIGITLLLFYLGQ